MERRTQVLSAAQDDLQPLHPLVVARRFDRIFASLAGDGTKPERIMIDTTHLKAYRTAASLLK